MAGSPGSRRESGAAARVPPAPPGANRSVGCCEGERAGSAVPSRRLERGGVLQLQAGLLLHPQHVLVSRRRVDTSSLIYRHRFVVRSRCLQDSADFTLA